MSDKLKLLMPTQIDLGWHHQTTISFPIYHRTTKQLDTFNPKGLPTVMGFIIPEWQRPLVWTEAQMISLIESIWLGIPIGTFSYTQTYDGMDGYLIDGQQRMYALEQYLNDAFPVFGYRWSETTVVDKRMFENRKFESYSVQNADEDFLRSYYDLLNFGGTAHTEDQRATGGTA